MQFRRAVFAALLTAAMIGLGRPAFARDYVITSGDSLEITVPGETDLTRTYTVNEEGKITVPYIGQVTAIGKDKVTLAAELNEKLKKYIKNPDVRVEIPNPNNTLVFVTGEVGNPGEVKVKPDSRILDVFAKVGNLKDTADKKAVVLQRGGKNITIDVLAAEQGDPTENVILEVNDRIIVPKKVEGKIKVLGEVATPGEKDLASRKMTPMEAIKAAGDFKDTANKTAVILQHKDGSRLTLDLEAASKGLADPLMDNLYLAEDDVLVVSAYGTVKILGEVATAGSKPLTRDMTAMDAINAAGGFKDTADKTAVKVRHADGTETKIDLAAASSGETSSDAWLLLKADDVVFVPNNKENRIVVTGPGVKKPGPITFEDGMTAFDAITQADGFQDKARTDKVVVVPKGGKPIVANLKRFASTGDASMNPVLQPGATVLVDVKQEKASGNDSWLKQTLSSTLSYIPTMYISKWIWD